MRINGQSFHTSNFMSPRFSARRPTPEIRKSKPQESACLRIKMIGRLLYNLLGVREVGLPCGIVEFDINSKA
jgi:hypothetical protein